MTISFVTRATALFFAGVLAAGTSAARAAGPGADPPRWRVIVANDTCPDVTWGLTEAEVRQAFADLIGAHLDEMSRTAGEPRRSCRG